MQATVITVSDRVSAGLATDASGPLAVQLLAEAGLVATVTVVPDEIDAIQEAIRASVRDGSRLVLTTGGTGISPRDVTPEATAPLLSAALPGIMEAVRARSLTAVPTAALSRSLAGIVRLDGHPAALIVNAPGSTGGVRDTVAVVGPLVSHVIDQLGGGDHPRSDGAA